ncbi:ABC transporter permease [Aureimonas ureilytica]|uniref:ABC transporter permease n=1 Tax=Aureimonas ureilytica TaxID=401562 RepID=UPI003CEBC2B0
MSAFPALRRGLLIGALLLPGLGYLMLFFAGPLLNVLYGSFLDEAGRFTLANYAEVFTRPTLQRGLSASVYYGVMPVLLTLAVSLPLALLLRRSFVGRAWFNGLYKIPMAVPGIIVALMLLTVGEQGGILSRLLAPIGLSAPRLVRDEWGVGVILASTWKQVPFMTLVITGAFAAIPEEVSHAARALGASRWRTVLFVEIPLAMPGITAAVLLTFIGSMGSYAIPDLVGPANPRPLSVLMVQAFNQGNFPEVFAMGMVLAGFAVAVLLAYDMMTSRFGQLTSEAAR